MESKKVLCAVRIQFLPSLTSSHCVLSVSVCIFEHKENT